MHSCSDPCQYIRPSIVLMVTSSPSWQAYSYHAVSWLLRHTCVAISCLLLGRGSICSRVSVLANVASSSLVTLKLLVQSCGVFTCCALHVAIQYVASVAWLILLLLEMLKSGSDLKTLLQIEKGGVLEPTVADEVVKLMPSLDDVQV